MGATPAVGMHPTGIHSCRVKNHMKFLFFFPMKVFFILRVKSIIVEIKYIYDSCLVYVHLETDEICKYVPVFQLKPLKFYLINVMEWHIPEKIQS